MEMNEITYLVYDAAGEYLGMSPLREQAVGAARTAAKNSGGFADVVRVAVTKSGTTTRRCRYHADGTVEQLWKAEGNQAAAAVRPHRPGDTGVIAMPMKKNVLSSWNPVMTIHWYKHSEDLKIMIILI